MDGEVGTAHGRHRSAPGREGAGRSGPAGDCVHDCFPAREDLFLGRSAGLADRPAGWVRGRREGESAAVAVLRELPGEVEAVSPRIGLMPGCARFLRIIHEAPALREETGAAVGDPMPELIAGRPNRLHNSVMTVIEREMLKRCDPREVSREVPALLGDIEDLLSGKVLNCAVRGA
ncbi:TetR/AcrR family transcriptional regulator [Streptomyces sp. NPDC005921]|uniref:TetR/AcrR family transcriptional regulator n=1 Tax=Streptomyces sp. NPDC005827 TaxID=3157070 RepID=UPI0033DCCF7E